MNGNLFLRFAMGQSDFKALASGIIIQNVLMHSGFNADDKSLGIMRAIKKWRCMNSDFAWYLISNKATKCCMRAIRPTSMFLRAAETANR